MLDPARRPQSYGERLLERRALPETLDVSAQRRALFRQRAELVGGVDGIADHDVRGRELVADEVLLAGQLFLEDFRVVPEHALPLFEPFLATLGLGQQEQMLRD